MHAAIDDQRAPSLGKRLAAYQLRGEVVKAAGEIRSLMHRGPINRGIAQQHPQPAFPGQSAVQRSHRPIKLFVDWFVSNIMRLSRVLPNTAESLVTHVLACPNLSITS